jgi:hypothetical protein
MLPIMKNIVKRPTVIIKELLVKKYQFEILFNE